MASQVEQLTVAIRLLASDSDGQIACLKDMGHFEGSRAESHDVDENWNIDEIALQFSDAAATKETMREKEEINQSQYDCVRRLEHTLATMGGAANAELWTIAALRRDVKWDRVREMARQCLELFGSDVSNGER